jgi:hypothetical protein
MNPILDRRSFIAGTMAATAGVALSAQGAEAPAAKDNNREYYELRYYHFRRGPMAKRADDYFKNALIPACERAGCGPIGVFNVAIGPEAPAAWVVIPHASAEALLTLKDRFADDGEYQKAGQEFIKAPATDPSYVSTDSWLLHAFAGIPTLEVPKKEPRIFELRTYHSHSLSAHRKKVEMFNTGEIAIFRRAGMTPVFFGSNVLGQGLPSLTYLLTFSDLAERDKAFGRFRSDPEWDKLKNTPGFTDAEIVTYISNTVLSPAAYSQI